MQNGQQKKKDNLLLNLLLNILIPVVILTKFSKPEYLGPVYGLVVALIFPFGYGIYDLLIRKRKNIISLLGFISILLTGIIGLLKFPPEWFAIKEGLIPFLVGSAILISTRTSFPLVNKLVYSDEIFDVEKIESSMQDEEAKKNFDKVLFRVSAYLTGLFYLTALLSFFLARFLIHSDPGTQQFNEELGRMTLFSYLIVTLPTLLLMFLIIRYLLNAIKKITNLPTGDIFVK